MANQYLQPFFDQLSQGTQIANQIRSTAQQQAQFESEQQQRQSEMKLREKDLALRQQQYDHGVERQGLLDKMNALQNGAQPLNKQGGLDQQMQVPSTGAPGSQPTTQMTNIPVDPGRTVQMGGQGMYMPTLDEQGKAELGRRVAQRRADEGVDLDTQGEAVPDHLVKEFGMAPGTRHTAKDIESFQKVYDAHNPAPDKPSKDETSDAMVEARTKQGKAQGLTGRDLQSFVLTGKFAEYPPKYTVNVGQGGGADFGGALPEPQAGQNPDAIAQYPKNIQNLAVMLANYDTPLPGGRAMSDPKSPWIAALQAAKQYDPSFSASQYENRRSLRKDFTSGKAADNAQSINTVISHMDRLNNSAAALGNGGVNLFNRSKNAMATQLPSAMPETAHALARFMQDRDVATDELRKAVGGSISEAAAERAIEKMSASKSPGELKAAIDESLALVGGRANELKSRYERGMGKALQIPLLNEDSKQILKKLGNKSFTEAGVASNPSAAKADPLGIR